MSKAANRPTRHLVAPLLALTIVSTAGTLASPWLVASPVLLVLLSPRLPFLALAARQLGVIPFLVVGTVRLCLGDPFHFAIGRRLGTAGAASAAVRLPGVALLTRSGHTKRVAAGAVLVRPIGRHVVLAGASGVRPGVVVALDLAGTVVYLLGVHAGSGLW